MEQIRKEAEKEQDEFWMKVIAETAKDQKKSIFGCG